MFSIGLKFSVNWIDWSFLEPIGFAKLNADGRFEIPFLDRMSMAFILCAVGMFVISWWDRRRGLESNGLVVSKSMFGVDRVFAVGGLLVCGILVALYMMFW